MPSSNGHKRIEADLSGEELLVPVARPADWDAESAANHAAAILWWRSTEVAE